jgi:hypothetical protein
LLQTEQAQKRLETDGSYQNSNEAIYFSIYKIINPKDDNKISNKKYLDKDLREVANSDTYFYQREVSKRFELPADEYVIIPSLFKMNVKMKFVLRMYIETSLADVKITELNKNFKKKPQIQEIIYSDPKPIPKESEVNDSGTGPVSNESEIIEPGPALASEENKIDVIKFFSIIHSVVYNIYYSHFLSNHMRMKMNITYMKMKLTIQITLTQEAIIVEILRFRNLMSI